MTATRPARVMIVSEAAHNRVSLARALTRRLWAPLPVATWDRACERGLDTAHVIITDSAALAAPGADLALLGLVPESVPIIVVGVGTSLPTWARHRVHRVARRDIPDYVERFRLVRAPLRQQCNRV